MGKIQLAAVEQETIIVWNRAEDMASIYTYEPTWQKHLEALGCKCVLDDKCGGKEYEIHKSRIMKPRAKREVSAENRAAAGARLRSWRANKTSKTLHGN